MSLWFDYTKTHKSRHLYKTVALRASNGHIAQTELS